jgi:hypothetical protein
MDIFEQYFDKQLDYTYYKYEDESWYNKGIDSLSLNSNLLPYYLYEIIEDEPDDWFYFPILNKEEQRHRFLDSQADYLFYFMKHTGKLYSSEPSVVRARIIELWQKEGSKYHNSALIDLANGFKYVAFPKEELEDIMTEHDISPAVLHLLKNYGSLTSLDNLPYNRTNTERETQ